MNKVDKLKAEMLKSSRATYNSMLCEFVKKVTASYFELEDNKSINTSRKKEVVKYRQIAMYLIKKHSSMSYTEIGREFGKDHATAIYSYNTEINSTFVQEQLVPEQSTAIKQNVSFYKDGIESNEETPF